MNKRLGLLAATAILLASIAAEAAGPNDVILRWLNPRDRPTLAASGLNSAADYLYVYDASADNIVKVLVPGFMTSTPSATELNYLDIGAAGTAEASKAIVLGASKEIATIGAITTSGTFTLNDDSGASPSFILQDGTDELATFSKVDAGYLTLTTDATDGLNILTGSLKVGNGTPDVTVNGEDAYVEGTLEVDGSVRLDGALSTNSTIAAAGDITLATGKALKSSTTTAQTMLLQGYDVDGAAYSTFLTITNGNTPAASLAAPAGGTLAVDGASVGAVTAGTGAFTTLSATGAINLGNGALTVNSTTVNTLMLQKGGRGFFTVCGDAVTVNNNTVYYGPDQTIVSSATVGQPKCDTTAAGNTTEATADTPALAGVAIYPLGMVCYVDDPNATISFTLRDNAANITPTISVSILDNITSGTASATATTAIAANDPVAVAVTSTSDVGTVHFICRVNYAY